MTHRVDEVAVCNQIAPHLLKLHLDDDLLNVPELKNDNRVGFQTLIRVIGYAEILLMSFPSSSVAWSNRLDSVIFIEVIEQSVFSFYEAFAVVEDLPAFQNLPNVEVVVLEVEVNEEVD